MVTSSSKQSVSARIGCINTSMRQVFVCVMIIFLVLVVCMCTDCSLLTLNICTSSQLYRPLPIETPFFNDDDVLGQAFTYFAVLNETWLMAGWCLLRSSCCPMQVFLSASPRFMQRDFLHQRQIPRFCKIQGWFLICCIFLRSLSNKNTFHWSYCLVR